MNGWSLADPVDDVGREAMDYMRSVVNLAAHAHIEQRTFPMRWSSDLNRTVRNLGEDSLKVAADPVLVVAQLLNMAALAMGEVLLANDRGMSLAPGFWKTIIEPAIGLYERAIQASQELDLQTEYGRLLQAAALAGKSSALRIDFEIRRDLLDGNRLDVNQFERIPADWGSLLLESVQLGRAAFALVNPAHVAEYGPFRGISISIRSNIGRLWMSIARAMEEATEAGQSRRASGQTPLHLPQQLYAIAESPVAAIELAIDWLESAAALVSVHEPQWPLVTASLAQCLILRGHQEDEAVAADLLRGARAAAPPRVVEGLTQLLSDAFASLDERSSQPEPHPGALTVAGEVEPQSSGRIQSGGARRGSVD